MKICQGNFSFIPLSNCVIALLSLFCSMRMNDSRMQRSFPPSVLSFLGLRVGSDLNDKLILCYAATLCPPCASPQPLHKHFLWFYNYITADDCGLQILSSSPHYLFFLLVFVLAHCIISSPPSLLCNMCYMWQTYQDFLSNVTHMSCLCLLAIVVCESVHY